MKTLNRTLSLALVFALVFSLMSFAFAADTTATTTTTTTGYTDAASITYKEAVDVTSAIGVFQGMDANAFSPKTSLTREQAAKIIAYLLIGKSNADKLTASTAPYTDVAASRWSAGCIAYCTNSHILAGYGDGTFGPTDNVTGYQFGKMLLVALGYDADVEGFTGSNWAVNVAKRGFENDLFKYNEQFNGNTAATREEAALYTCNTLRSSPVYYQSKGTTVSSNGTTIHVGATAPEHYTKISGGNTVNKSYADMYFPNLGYTETATDNLGRAARSWTYYTKPIGAYPVLPATLTYTAKTTEATVTKDLKNYSFASTNLTEYTNGFKTAAFTKTAAAIAGLTANGRTVEVSTYNGVITNVVAYNSVLAKVTLVNTSKGTVSYTVPGNAYMGSLTINSDVGYGIVKLNDYVIVTPYDAGSATITSSSSIDSVVAATPVMGKANAKSDSDKTITLGGKTYTASANIVSGNAVSDFTPSVKDDSTLLLDKNGYIVYAKSSATETSDRAIGVYRFSQSLVNNEIVTSAVGITSDGNQVTLPLDSAAGNNKTNLGICTYSVSTTEAGKYDLSAPLTTPASYSATTKVFTKATATMAASDKAALDGSTPYTFANDVKVIYVDTTNKTYKVMSGAQTIASTTLTYAVGKVNDENRIIAVYTTTAPTAMSTLSDQLVYVNGTTSGLLTNDSGKHETYKAYVNGKAVDGFTTALATDLGYMKSGFYNIDKNATTGDYNVANTNRFVGSEAAGNTLAAANGLVAGLTKDASVVTIAGYHAGNPGAKQLTLDATKTVFYNEDSDAVENVLTFASEVAESAQQGEFALSVQALYNPQTGVATYVYFSKYTDLNYVGAAALTPALAVDVDAQTIVGATTDTTYGQLASLAFAGQTVKYAATDVGFAAAAAGAAIAKTDTTVLTSGTHYLYVMPKNGTTATKYVVTVGPSHDATLNPANKATVTIEGGAATAYTLYASVDAAVAGTKIPAGTSKKITALAVANNGSATVAYDLQHGWTTGAFASSGAFVNGTSTTSAATATDILKVAVTAADGTTTQVYYVAITVT